MYTHIDGNVIETCRRYHIQNTKLTKQHHGKKTVNVKLYQNTKLDAHTYSKQKIGEGTKYRIGKVSDTSYL